MKYQVKLKAPKDMTEKNYCHGGNTLCEERYGGIKYGIWFDSLEEAKNECIKHKAYGIIDDDLLEYVWYNPDYKSELKSFKDCKSIKDLRSFLGKILLPY